METENTQAQEEKASSVADLKTFVLEEQKLVTIFGAEVPVPPLSYGKERMISAMIGEVADSIAKVITKQKIENPAEALKVGAEAIGEILKLVFGDAPEKVRKATSILLSSKGNAVTEEWVDENLVSDSIAPFLMPFLADRKEALSKALAPYMVNLTEMLQGFVEQMKP